MTSCLGKVFCSLLNNRILKHLHNPIHKSQIGFQAGSQTSDHLFTLKTLIDTHVKAKSRGKIFACFIDFRKAFDSIWHQGLFYKLIKSKIGGNVYRLIKEMYNKSNCSIKLNRGLCAKPFSYDRGVRQGCVLSPILFNLFINDIPKILESESVNPFVLPNGEKLSCLMYADDLIMLSQTATGLQKCLDVLSEFCSKWGFSVNLNKTKTMVFQKKNKQANKYTFKCNDEVVETVSHYTYLGMKISGSGDFTKGTDVLSNKAKNALAALRKKLSIEKLSLTIVNKLFTSFCLPICTYVAEVWGTSLTDDFDFWDKHNVEKTHLHFCKTFLGVNKKASNIGCLAEMGRFPIKIDIDTKILKCWIHLDSFDDNKIVK